jgi:hypothetical protein
MLTWLLWITGEYGHFGGKIIPVSEHESWHTLDPLVHLDTPPVRGSDPGSTRRAPEVSVATAHLLLDTSRS